MIASCDLHKEDIGTEFSLSPKFPSLLWLCMHAKSLQSCLILCDPMDCSPPPPPSLKFPRQYWSGLPCPPSGDLDPGIKHISMSTCIGSLYH